MNDPDDVFARAWLSEKMSHGTDLTRAVAVDLGPSVWDFSPVGDVFLVTPGTGRTSGIAALFWVYATGAETITVATSRSDEWTSKFIEYLSDVGIMDVGSAATQSDEELQNFLDAHEVHVVYGSNETIKRFKNLSTPEVGLYYGSRASFAIHDSETYRDKHVAQYYRDLVTYDGHGCLNTTTFYVPRLTDDLREMFVKITDKVREKYSDVASKVVRSQFLAESVIVPFVQERVGDFLVRTENIGERTTPLPVGYGTAFIVEYGDNPRIVRDEWNHTFASSVTLVGSGEKWLPILRKSGVSRITDPGEAQNPSLLWTHDGGKNLVPMVRLVCMETSK
ncbi:acyl-CoA reductase [Streptomyces sp. CoH17]|uniref:acyl-CoA reductase n=1 Tax=Streptomyces sp. CoH17 TaxID=2992806 RepID=UPI0022705F7E|nr:acyl-CoA reductase [Streptomyces sp. CoH17]